MFLKLAGAPEGKPSSYAQTALPSAFTRVRGGRGERVPPRGSGKR